MELVNPIAEEFWDMRQEYLEVGSKIIVETDKTKFKTPMVVVKPYEHSDTILQTNRGTMYVISQRGKYKNDYPTLALSRREGFKWWGEITRLELVE